MNNNSFCNASKLDVDSIENQRIKEPFIKVAMYLQTDELKNKKAFDKILPIMKNAYADIIVFPEYCYVPFVDEISSLHMEIIINHVEGVKILVSMKSKSF